MEKNRLDKNCMCAMNAASMNNDFAVAGKRVVEQIEEKLEQEVDSLISAGLKVDPAKVEEIGQRIYNMRKPVVSERFVRICKKYARLKLVDKTKEYYNFVQGIILCEEKNK